ncbi:MAG: methyltransferase domain-containing protein [Alphaproteobacteria bacterium]|nr:methyltransferase domain-containing protein [Alphaproteobacteria bacterium]
MRIFLKMLEAQLRDPRQFSVPQTARHCPICGYEGVFLALGTPPRWNGRCPSCGSRERHRLIHLWLEQAGLPLESFDTILHFAPEKHVKRMLQDKPGYTTADIVPGKADLAMDIAEITLPEASVDLVIANHVLEHVPDDRRAMAGIGRCLKPGGLALITVPQNWAREETYENPAVTSEAEKFAHYDDSGHVRYYGRDFEARFAAASGLDVQVWRMPPEEEARYGLYKGDVLFIGRKQAAS